MPRASPKCSPCLGPADERAAGHRFIVPHIRDTKGGRKPITATRDIYENNANMGARRVRECIFAAIPRWFTDEAEDLCRQTLGARRRRPVREAAGRHAGGVQVLGVTQRDDRKAVGSAGGQSDRRRNLPISRSSIARSRTAKSRATKHSPKRPRPTSPRRCRRRRRRLTGRRPKRRSESRGRCADVSPRKPRPQPRPQTTPQPSP
jgi:hypothetical protein